MPYAKLIEMLFYPNKRYLIFVLVIILWETTLNAQKKRSEKDSVEFYRRIEKYSKKRKITNFFYQLVFKPLPEKSANKIKVKKIKSKIIDPYIAYEGKIIRNIQIEPLDPFGNSVKLDTTTNQNFIYKAGNKVHIKSQRITIRNLLLFKRNDKFDSLLVKESERLIRTQSYIHDVAFRFVPTEHKDSVDIFIRELDNWSIAPEFEASTSRITFGLSDDNFLGLGHKFSNIISWNHTNGKNSFNTDYQVKNIRNSYITSRINYSIDEYKNSLIRFNIERPFFSAFTRWAGGILLSQEKRRDSLLLNDGAYFPYNLKFKYQDIWLGHANKLFAGQSEDDRTTNLIISGRFIRTRYLEKPEHIYDTLNYYGNEDFYLASVGLVTRKYIKDNYIFNYGINEYVPVGKVYGLTLGSQYKGGINRLYVGIRYSIGDYIPWGYFSSNFEYGTFIRSSRAEQGILSVGLHYFTPLMNIGKWKFRQFIKPQLTIGINRKAYDTLTLHSETGLEGFNSKALIGSSRLILTLQTQSYAPWVFLGFRFGPYFSYSFGLLGDQINGFRHSKFYSSLGLGILLKNDNLVLNLFQVSISFFPSIPGNGENIFKFNTFQTTDFGFRDFEFGKPAVVEFR